MKRKLYQDEFEDFLSEAAEDLRMYPSSRVWHAIDNKIHGEKKWPALTFAAILIGAISLAGLIFMQPEKDLFTTRHISGSVSTPAIAEAKANTTFEVSNSFPGVVNQQPDVPFEKQRQKIRMNAADLDDANAVVDGALQESISSMEEQHASFASATGISSSLTQPETEWPQQSMTQSIQLQEEYTITQLNEMQAGINPETALLLTPAIQLPQQNVDSYSPSMKNPSTRKSSRWSMQYYATPSLSYRMLSEVKAGSSPAGFGASVVGNTSPSVNAMVNHKPKLGVEMGVAALYQITDYFAVKAGLQLNYRQYAIDAYASPSNQTAYLRIDQGNNRYDTILASTNVSNMGNPQNNMQVHNNYFQVALPVGFELSMAKFSSTQFVLSATFQPTYNIGQQSWLISTDYQSYVKQPDLMRRWNFNTGIEAFLRFSNKSGNLNWQVGPQVRYQLLPGAEKKYPVREHLIDYGLKIGVSKTLK